MKTIKSNSSYQIEIKNSKFITELIKIDNSDIKDILDELKKKYPKATHYTYAYRLLDKEKSSDDGEPGGTAGVPMLNVLIKEDIINVLVVTIRYFGGIKLGAGGLVRAYSKSLIEALKHTELHELTEGYKVKITIPYDKQKDLDYLLKDQIVLAKDFALDITYEVYINDLEILNNYDYEIITKTYY
jgi:uncharacterized YigZ family protein